MYFVVISRRLLRILVRVLICGESESESERVSECERGGGGEGRRGKGRKGKERKQKQSKCFDKVNAII